jgi:hypothetical protein
MAAGLALHAAAADAYDFLRSPKGVIASRAERVVVFRFPAHVPAGLDRAQVRAATERALGRWADASGLVLRLEDAPPNPATGCYEGELDLNDIVFVEGGWRRLAGAVAETPVCMGQDSGRIYGADILLNASDFQFAVLPPNHQKGGIAYDVESVLTHEVGHALGMGHSKVKTAVMWGGGERGDVSKRELTDDDVLGIQSLYPAEDTGSVGCSSGVGGRGALGLLGILALLTKRPSRRRAH